MADSWQAKLSKYMFYVDVSPPGQGSGSSGEMCNYFELLCTVTDWTTNAEHKISVVYAPIFSEVLQGIVLGPDEDYEINLTTNSSVLIQHIQWTLALPNTKMFSSRAHRPMRITPMR